MKASNASTRNNAILYAALWTVIPMLLSASGVFIHFRLKQTATDINRDKFEKIQKQISRDSAFFEKMLNGIASMDSLFKSMEQTEKLYQSALQSNSPDDISLYADLDNQTRLLKYRIESLKRDMAGSSQSVISSALFGQYFLVLNFKEKIRKTWKSETAPTCPECEAKVKELEKAKEELFAKYIACLTPKPNPGGNSADEKMQLRLLQTEKIMIDKEKADLKKEAQHWQKMHSDLVTNLKEVVVNKSPSGNKKEKLSHCEDQIKLIKSIIWGGGKSSNAAKANNND